MAKDFELVEAVVYVQDMNRMVGFFRDGLGMDVKNPSDLTDYSGTFRVELKTGDCTLVLNQGGQPCVGDAGNKLIFRVKDLREIHEMLRTREIKVSGIRSPEEGVWLCDFVDPEQNKYSFEQRGGRAPTLEMV